MLHIETANSAPEAASIAATPGVKSSISSWPYTHSPRRNFALTGFIRTSEPWIDNNKLFVDQQLAAIRTAFHYAFARIVPASSGSRRSRTSRLTTFLGGMPSRLNRAFTVDAAHVPEQFFRPQRNNNARLRITLSSFTSGELSSRGSFCSTVQCGAGDGAADQRNERAPPDRLWAPRAGTRPVPPLHQF